jgi:integrase
MRRRALFRWLDVTGRDQPALGSTARRTQRDKGGLPGHVIRLRRDQGRLEPGTELACGLPLIYVQRQLGHASIKTTERAYGHLEESYLRGAAERVEAAIWTADSEVSVAEPP